MFADKFVEENELCVKSYDEARAAINTDFKVKHYGDELRKMSLTEAGTLKTVAGEFPLTEGAFSGLCSAVKIPPGFGKRIPEELFLHNFETLRLKYNARVRICISRGTAVGISDISPEPISNAEIIDKVGAVAHNACMALHEVRISDRGMQVNMLHKDKNLEPLRGDITAVGVNIVTSEMGLKSTKASLFLLRLACTNGAVVKKAWGGYERFFNYKINREKSLSAFLDKIPKIDIDFAKFSNSYRKLTERILNAAEFIGLHDKLAGIVGTDTADNISGIERDQRIEIHQKIKRDIDRSRPTGIMAYDFYNAVTHAAKEYPFEKRQDLENFGGSIIRLANAISLN
jgi:hypothetical protein